MEKKKDQNELAATETELAKAATAGASRLRLSVTRMKKLRSQVKGGTTGDSWQAEDAVVLRAAAGFGELTRRAAPARPARPDPNDARGPERPREPRRPASPWSLGGATDCSLVGF